MALRSYSVFDILLPTIIIIIQECSQALKICKCTWSLSCGVVLNMLSSLCTFIWKHWTYKMPVRYILSSVSVRLSIFSHLFIILYMGLCVFSLPISLVMIERIYTLSYYHHQIGSMNYYPLFMAMSWNNGMHCLSIFLYHVKNGLYMRTMETASLYHIDYVNGTYFIHWTIYANLYHNFKEIQDNLFPFF